MMSPGINEIAIWCSGGCRVIGAGRGAEIAPDRSASWPTHEVWRNPAGLPMSSEAIDWRQRPGPGRLQRTRPARPDRSIRHHPMLEAFYWLEIPGGYYAIVVSWPMAESST